MKRMIQAMLVLLGVLCGSLEPAGAQGGRRAIDTQHSVITVRVYRAGPFSIFGHDHEIRAPIDEGQVQDSETASVELRLDAAKLRVVDPDLAENKRAEVQKTMQGPAVLDSSRFPEVRFRSTLVEKTGANHWTVRGDLTLHGQSRPVVVEVIKTGGQYQGSATLKQRDFGINPVSFAGGALKVKNEVKVHFEIALTQFP